MDSFGIFLAEENYQFYLTLFATNTIVITRWAYLGFKSTCDVNPSVHLSLSLVHADMWCTTKEYYREMNIFLAFFDYLHFKLFLKRWLTSWQINYLVVFLWVYMCRNLYRSKYEFMWKWATLWAWIIAKWDEYKRKRGWSRLKVYK